MGDHSLRNVAAAAAGAIAAGVSLDCFCTAASSFIPPDGRLTRSDIRNGSKQVILIDDSYNANPDSVEAAIAVLASFPGARLLILSDIADCGTPEREIHRSLGKIALDRGIDAVWSIGQASSAASRLFGINGRHFPDLYRVLNAANDALDFDVILVKGSRKCRLEHLVREIKVISKRPATEPPVIAEVCPLTSNEPGES
jgi:UDP-N-acetylmuramyl pentapeptide synthase